MQQREPLTDVRAAPGRSPGPTHGGDTLYGSKGRSVPTTLAKRLAARAPAYTTGSERDVESCTGPRGPARTGLARSGLPNSAFHNQGGAAAPPARPLASGVRRWGAGPSRRPGRRHSGPLIRSAIRRVPLRPEARTTHARTPRLGTPKRWPPTSGTYRAGRSRPISPAQATGAIAPRTMNPDAGPRANPAPSAPRRGSAGATTRIVRERTRQIIGTLSSLSEQDDLFRLADASRAGPTRGDAGQDDAGPIARRPRREDHSTRRRGTTASSPRSRSPYARRRPITRSIHRRGPSCRSRTAARRRVC